jgi:hypothetical protein
MIPLVELLVKIDEKETKGMFTLHQEHPLYMYSGTERKFSLVP